MLVAHHEDVAFNTKKKWIGSLEGTAIGERGSDGSHLRDDVESDLPAEPPAPGEISINPANYNDKARKVGVRLLSLEDRRQHLGAGVRNAHTLPLAGRALQGSDREWLHNADGILAAWSAVVYSDTEDAFWHEWFILMNEFVNQTTYVTFLLTCCILTTIAN